MRQGRLKGTLSSEGHAAKAAFQFLHPGRNAYRRCRLGDNGAACDKPERRAERGKTHQRAREMNTHASLGLTNRHGLSGLTGACRCRNSCTAAKRKNIRANVRAGTSGSDTMYRRGADDASAPSIPETGSRRSRDAVSFVSRRRNNSHTNEAISPNQEDIRKQTLDTVVLDP